MKNEIVIVILGQTATGKSALAVKIAKKINGEIISADSRQVYKGLNLGTGKVNKKEMKGIPHHLLDVANPRTRFSIVEFQKLANKKIKEIAGKKKIPIICGGTGFYIDAIVKGVSFPEVPPNLKLRRNLENRTAQSLFKILKVLDPERAANIDPKNKVRLIRAIEIAKSIGKTPKMKGAPLPYKFIKLGLYLPPEKLRKKIQERLTARMKSGMLTEAKKLHKQGLSWKRMEELGLEYKFLSLYLKGIMSKKEMEEKLSLEIYKYAKRQITWFKRDKEIIWADTSNPREISQLWKTLLENN